MGESDTESKVCREQGSKDDIGKQGIQIFGKWNQTNLFQDNTDTVNALVCLAIFQGRSHVDPFKPN